MTAEPKIHHMYLSYQPRPGMKIEHISCGLHPVSARYRTSNTADVTCNRCRRSSWFKVATKVEADYARIAAAPSLARPPGLF